MAGDYKLNSVTTFEKGAILEYDHIDPGIPRSEKYRDAPKDKRDLPVTIAFYDKNNNGKLDRGDQKIGFYRYAESKPKIKGKKLGNGKTAFDFKSQVTSQDIRNFGEESNSLFQQAREEREKLKTLEVLLTGVSKGGCAIPHKRDEGHGNLGITPNFTSNFSLTTIGEKIDSTKPDPKTYEELINDLDRLGYRWGRHSHFGEVLYGGRVSPDTEEVDPAKCFSVSARIYVGDSVNPHLGLSLGFLNMKGQVSLEMDDSAGPSLIMLLEDFKLSNNRRYVDISYEWGDEFHPVYGHVEVHHVDFTPEEMKAVTKEVSDNVKEE